jgi:hypothetical protein
MTKSIKERRLDAIYSYRNCSNSTQQKELLDFLLATASHEIIRQAIEEFNIKVDKK